METVLFNFSWTRWYGKPLPWRKQSDAVQVDLPDDFVCNMPRSPKAVGGGSVGFAGDGFATYEKYVEMRDTWIGKNIFLCIDGAYMNTEVYCNGDYVGKHPYGYTPFVVDLTRKFRNDMPNKLSITTQGNQPSSRWYSGAGLYREVSLWIGEKCYLDPRDLYITTPEVNKTQAAVRVKGKVTNTTEADVLCEIKSSLSFQNQIIAECKQKLSLDAAKKNGI